MFIASTEGYYEVRAGAQLRSTWYKVFLMLRMDYFSVQIEYGYGSRLVVILFQILLFIPGTYLPYIQKMMKRTTLMFAKSFDDSLTLPVHR